MNRGVTLYGIIADLRPELGRTRDNLKEAVEALTAKSLPPGGKEVLDELVERARRADVYDLDYGKDPYDRPAAEELDEGTLGIGILLGVTSLIGIVLAALAVYAGINAIMHTPGA
jgi:hypothetical protein